MKKTDISLCEKLNELLPSVFEKFNLISGAAESYEAGITKEDDLSAEIIVDVGDFMVTIYKLIADNEPFLKTYVDAQIKRYTDPENTKHCPDIIETPAFVSYLNALKKAQASFKGKK